MSEVFQWVIGVAAVVACLAVVGQFAIFAAIYRALTEAQKAGKEAGAKIGPLVERIGPLVERVGPVVERIDSLLTTTGKILEENGPRISNITAESLLIVKAARQHADRIGELIDETNDRAKARIAQLDESVGHTVEQVEHAGDVVKSAVLRPVREANGIVAGVKAALNTYAQGGNRSPARATQDEEMFI
jgi:hypothetical protein